jgi:hypothetical protein
MVTDKQKQGKANKAAGAKFEKKVREHFESQDWIVTKWRNNIEDGKIVKAKQHYIPGRGAILGSGFPDFVMFKKDHHESHYSVIFVEAKLNGLLSKEEKLKCKVLKELGHTTLIAYEDKSQDNNIRTREFIYTDGKEKIPRG